MGLDINLHPKQLLALTSPANEILYGGAVGGGKALHVDTPLLTTEGWKTMGTVEIGDKVFDERGVPCNVVAKSEVDTESPTYRVQFSNNKDIFLIADGRHQWVTSQGLLTTEQLTGGESIVATEPLQNTEKEFPIDPYVLGVYLAGGVEDWKTRKGMFLQKGVSRTSHINLQVFDDGKYYAKDDWYKLTDALGLSKENKFIPDMYFTGSEKQREALLAGYFDTRGSVAPASGNQKTKGRAEVIVTHEQIGRDLVKMFATLGEIGYYYSFEGTNHALFGAGRVRIRLKRNIFRSKHRRKRIEQVYKKRSITPCKKRYKVAYVEEIEKAPKQCIQVDSPSHCYLAGHYLIPTHNSYLMRVASIIWAMECPGIQIYLFRRTRKELDDNHMVGSGGYYDLLSGAVNSKYIKINGSKHEIQFRNGPHNSFLNGSIIHLCHCQHEDDKYLYHGAEMSVLMLDEATHFSASIYSFLRTRVRIPRGWTPPKSFTDKWGDKFFPRILLGSNPGGLAHSYFRKEFVKIAPPLTITQMPKKQGGMLRQYIPARLDDNPSIDKEEYEGRVMAVGNPDIARMLLEGDWDAVAGGMFDDVWDESVHVIEPFEIPGDWYVDRSFDWGYTDPFSVGWWAQSDGSQVTLRDGTKVTYPKGSLFRIAEWYGWTGEENAGAGLTGYEVGLGIKRKELEDPIFETIPKVYPGPADTQIWNNSPKQDSAYRSIAQEINAGYYNNDGYAMFDIFTKADKTYGSRIRGWDILRTHLKNSLSFPKIDRECIFFFNTCPTPGRIIPVTIRDDRHIEDIANKQEDHVLDEIRYRVQHAVQKPRRIRTRIG